MLPEIDRGNAIVGTERDFPTERRDASRLKQKKKTLQNLCAAGFGALARGEELPADARELAGDPGRPRAGLR